MDSALPVTVVIPAYNRAGMLPRALASVAAQVRAPAEVIVVDDGSADATAAVAEELGARVVRHPVNRGLCAARNSGVDAATQPWLAFLDSDDEWLPHHLATLWAIRGGHVLASGTSVCCGPDAGADYLHGPAGDGVAVLDGPARLVFPYNLITVSAAMVRTDVVRELGGFRPFYGVEDLDLWLRVLERGTGAVAARPTARYHVHPEQMSGNRKAMQDGHIAVASQHAGRPWWSPELVERWRATAAWSDLRSAVRGRRVPDALRLAAWLARRPLRVGAVAAGGAVRMRLARRGARFGRDGRASVAVVGGDAALAARAAAVADGRRLRALSGPAGWLALARRPAGAALAPSRPAALLARALGTPAAATDARLRRLLAEQER